MYFDLAALPEEAADKLLHSTVVPRPIAWVSSLDAEGRGNLAPFSFFNVFSTRPPIVGLGIGARADDGARPKDTAANIVATREFVVNVVGFASRAAMNVSGSVVPTGVDEAELAGVGMIASARVKPRRVAASPVALECVLQQAIELAPANHLILGRVVAVHIADAMVLDAERFHVDAPGLDLIGRMHGSGWYARTTDLFQMVRI